MKLHIYSKSSCVMCDATARAVNTAIEKGQITADQITVHMIDGTSPREGKLADGINVVIVEGTVAQEKVRQELLDNPALGLRAPAVLLKDESGDEVVAFSGFDPDALQSAFAELQPRELAAVA